MCNVTPFLIFLFPFGRNMGSFSLKLHSCHHFLKFVLTVIETARLNRKEKNKRKWIWLWFFIGSMRLPVETPLSTLPGLGTKTNYKAPSDLKVKIVLKWSDYHHVIEDIPSTVVWCIVISNALGQSNSS